MAGASTEAARLSRMNAMFQRAQKDGVSMGEARYLIRLEQIDARRIAREERRQRRREEMEAEQGEGAFWWNKGPMA
jgi:hypothetical protein